MILLFGNSPPNDAALFRLPPATPDLSLGNTGGGYGSQPDTLHRRIPQGGNMALSAFKAYHYGERKLPGRLYEAYQQVFGFSRWLR